MLASEQTEALQTADGDLELRRSILRSFPAAGAATRARGLTSLLWLGRTAGLFGAAVLLLTTDTLVGAAATFVLIGMCQYHVSVAVHEASHFGLFRSRSLNDAVGGALATLVGFNLPGYRVHHMAHHRFYGTTADPDRAAYAGAFVSPWQLMRFLLGRYTLIGLLRRVLAQTTGVEAPTTDAVPSGRNYAYVTPLLIVQAGVFAFFWLVHAVWSYAIFWALPLVIFPGLLNGLRMFGEHTDLDGSEGQVFSARSTLRRGWSPAALGAHLERFILAPFNFNLHHEHHLFPQLPYSVLPALHAHLRASGHYTRHPQVLATSYAATVAGHLRRHAGPSR